MEQLQSLELDLKSLLQRRQHLQQTLAEIESEIQECESDFINNSTLLVDRKKRESFRLFTRKKRKRNDPLI